MMAIRSVGRQEGAHVWLVGIAALTGYVALSSVVWRVADWLRREMMPVAFISTGFLDTIRVRVFWAVGPQFFGLLFLALAGCMSVAGWGSPSRSNKSVAGTQTVAPVAVVQTTEEKPEEHRDPAPVNAKSATSLCAKPDVLALVRDEIHGALIMQIKVTHRVNLDMAQMRRMARIDLGNVREVQEAPYFIDCLASFDQRADSTAAEYGLTAVHDPELTYWIQRDASGNLQVGVGD
ncbi:MAG: hypothetical protein IPG63_07555 [Xanthomonadales bacterium]|nr:hypothetical protein [Xanthomonadales bacterium]